MFNRGIWLRMLKTETPLTGFNHIDTFNFLIRILKEFAVFELIQRALASPLGPRDSSSSYSSSRISSFPHACDCFSLGICSCI